MSDDAMSEQTGGTVNNGRDCKHGQLARSCERCEMETEIGELRFVIADIAQYDPRWAGMHVNDAPSRQELIGRAYEAWDNSQSGRGQ